MKLQQVFHILDVVAADSGIVEHFTVLQLPRLKDRGHFRGHQAPEVNIQEIVVVLLLVDYPGWFAPDSYAVLILQGLLVVLDVLLDSPPKLFYHNFDMLQLERLRQLRQHLL